MNKTAIQWTDRTWNPVTGCDRISPGCLNCYAKTQHDMRHKALLAGKKLAAQQYREPFEKIQLHPKRIDALPMRGKPCKVFVNSGSDLFHEDVPDDFLDQIFAAMALRPHMTFQILTKRPERMAAYMSAIITSRLEHFVLPLPNVWLGVSVENQKFADERIPWLLKTPAAVRFLSCEPLLGPVDLTEGGHGWINVTDLADGRRTGINWVIVGGESGAGARPMHPNWARSIRDQCQAAGVPFFFKQWGDFPAMPETEWRALSALGPIPLLKYTQRKDARERDGWLRLAVSGRQLDGREWSEFPEVAHAHAV